MDKPPYLAELEEDLVGLSGEDQLMFLVELSQELAPFIDLYRTPENKVPGCVSNVYIHGEMKEKKIFFSGCSESLIVGGYIQLLLQTVNGLTPKRIVEVETYLEEFLKKTDLQASLLNSRANAFGNIFKVMKAQASTLGKGE